MQYSAKHIKNFQEFIMFFRYKKLKNLSSMFNVIKNIYRYETGNGPTIIIRYKNGKRDVFYCTWNLYFAFNDEIKKELLNVLVKKKISTD